MDSMGKGTDEPWGPCNAIIIDKTIEGLLPKGSPQPRLAFLVSILLSKHIHIAMSFPPPREIGASPAEQLRDICMGHKAEGEAQLQGQSGLRGSSQDLREKHTEGTPGPCQTPEAKKRPPPWHSSHSSSSLTGPCSYCSDLPRAKARTALAQKRCSHSL